MKRKQSFRQRNRIKIFITGEVGSGKSSLVNAMLGNVLAHAGHGPKVNQTQTEEHYGRYWDTDVEICETVGFTNPNMDDRSVFKKMRKFSDGAAAECDVFLICHKMDVRCDDRVKQMLQCLSKHANPEIWEHAVVVLTFANFFLQQQGVSEMKDEGKKELMKRHKKDTKKLFKGFTKDTIKPEVFDNIPFVYAGIEREFRLPTTKNWIHKIWKACIYRYSDTPIPIKRRKKLQSLFQRNHRRQNDSFSVSVHLTESSSDEENIELSNGKPESESNLQKNKTKNEVQHLADETEQNYVSNADINNSIVDVTQLKPNDHESSKDKANDFKKEHISTEDATGMMDDPSDRWSLGMETFAEELLKNMK